MAGMESAEYYRPPRLVLISSKVEEAHILKEEVLQGFSNKEHPPSVKV